MEVLCILGTLGSGKTTVLNHILPTWSDKRVLVVVNDVGTVNVDVKRINHSGEVKAMTAGCIGCNDFAAFQKLFLEAINSGIELLIIEPTGIADGREIVQAVSAQQNCEVYCLTLVDVAHFYRNRALNTLPTQIEVANDILLTWTSAESSLYNQVLDYIARYSLGARINEIDIDDVDGLQRLVAQMSRNKIVNFKFEKDNNSHNHSNHGVYAYSIAFKDTITFADLVLSIIPYKDILLRAKGLVAGREFDFVQGDLVQRGFSNGLSAGNFISNQPLPENAFSNIRDLVVTDQRNKKQRMQSSDDIPLKDTLAAIDWQLGQYPSVEGNGFLRVDFEADVAYQISKRPGVPTKIWQQVLQKYFYMRVLAGNQIVSGKWDSHPDLPYWKRRVGMNLAWHMKNYSNDLTDDLCMSAMQLNPSSMALDGLRQIESLSFVEEMAEERPEIIKEVIEFGSKFENLKNAEDVILRCIDLAEQNPEWKARWQKLL